jgi:D-alanine-D-alanine ligase
VSVCSARNVYDAVDKSKYDISLVRIEKSGEWTLLSSATELRATPGFERFDSSLPELQQPAPSESQMLRTIAASSLDQGVDVVFPLIHGAFGEDGCLQGVFAPTQPSICWHRCARVGAALLGFWVVPNGEHFLTRRNVITDG